LCTRTAATIVDPLQQLGEMPCANAARARS
jgi:hypothetical protein